MTPSAVPANLNFVFMTRSPWNSPLSDPSLAPALWIAKDSGVARDRRRDIIVMERTKLRTDSDT
jgi:hypothetical protein